MIFFVINYGFEFYFGGGKSNVLGLFSVFNKFS